jgi:hypothetical protein
VCEYAGEVVKVPKGAAKNKTGDGEHKKKKGTKMK